MKWLVRGGIAIVLILIVVLIGVVLMINSIARRGVETGAGYALGVPTSLQTAKVGLLSGQFDMDQLLVADPPGYDNPHFLSLSRGELSVGLGSLMRDIVEVPRLSLDGIDLYVQRKEGVANYQVILDNLKRLRSAEEDPAEQRSGKKLIIRDLTITNAKVTVSGYGMGQQVYELPTIQMTNIGSDGEGVDTAYLTGIIMTSLFQNLAANVANLPGALTEGLGQGLAGLGDLGQESLQALGDVGAKLTETLGGFGDIGGKAGDVVGGVGEQAGKAAEDITRGIGGLLRGGDREKKDDE